MLPLVDVHTHLTDPTFANDLPQVIGHANAVGVHYMISNGLNPVTNRQVLAIAATHPSVLPALGIYPVDAVNDRLPADLPFKVDAFDVDGEIAFIDQCASKNLLVAVGECGLDGHWIKDETFARQEEVFIRLIEVALRNDLPLIIHTRKLEKRSMEILEFHQVKKVNFHCYGGKTNLAIQACLKHGWWFSIPANARNSESFTKLLRELPLERILTETDAPYLAPKRGERNAPFNVPGTVEYLAELRGFTVERAAECVYMNFQQLFGASIAKLRRSLKPDVEA